MSDYMLKRSGGHISGPYSMEQLLQMAQRGALVSSDQIQEFGGSSWKSAKDLLPADPPSPKPHVRDLEVADPNPEDFHCPKCCSVTTQRVAIAYANGTSHAQGRMFAASMSVAESGLVPTITESDGEVVHQSVLATQLAPPEPRRYLDYTRDMVGFLVLVPMLVGVVGIVLAASAEKYVHVRQAHIVWNCAFVIIALAVTAVWCVGVRKVVRNLHETARFNSCVLPLLVEEWESSWICLRCGAKFKPRTRSASLVK